MGMMTMQKKYKITLIFIAILIALMCTIEIHYQQYQKASKDLVALIDVQEGLSVNYVDGRYIAVSTKEKQITFSVTNLTTEKMYYSVLFQNFTGNPDQVSYELKENENVTNSPSLKEGEASAHIVIEPNKTNRYTLTINNPLEKTFSFYIQVDVDNNDESFYSTILKKNDVKEESNINFSEGATTNEGLIKKEEDNGPIYYFRGSNLNNYVSFGGFLWRIVKINADGTVKVILDNVTEDIVTVNESDSTGNTNFLNTKIYHTLLDWYNANLSNYEEYIASPNYCYDDSVYTETDDETDYLPTYRIFNDNYPTNACNGTSLSLKIGLLNADEIMYAGGSTKDNTSYYLNLDSLQSSWWTMTPSKKHGTEISYITVSTAGALQNDIKETESHFLRPVISFNRKVSVVGEGTKENPFELVM